MRIETFAGWAEYHASLFGFGSGPNADRHAAMLSAWVGLFAEGGFTVAELVAASKALAREPPRFREDHLGLLQDHARRGRRAEPPAEDRGRCTACDGNGAVWVPAAGLFVGHRRRRREPDDGDRLLQAYCPCPLGRHQRREWDGYVARLAQRDDRYAGCRGLGLDEYEAVFPDWRGRLAALAALRERGRKARGVTRALDRELGELLRRARDAARDVNGEG